MVKIAIISDIHANIHALNLVLKDIEKRNVDQIVCLGDLVTKYFYPAEVVDAIKENASLVLKGNCDNLVATNERYKFARRELNLERIEYLNELPIKEQIMIDKTLLYLYHSTPTSLDEMFNPLFNANSQTNYRNNMISDYKKMFVSNDPQISIVAHTHQHYIGIEKKEKLEIQNSLNAVIHTNNRAIINVGSTGENNFMKDYDEKYFPLIKPFLTYAIIESAPLNKGVNIQIVKVPYKETLKNVYFDMKRLQEIKKAPYSPNDTKKVYNSLISMGYSEETLSRVRK